MDSSVATVELLIVECTGRRWGEIENGEELIKQRKNEGDSTNGREANE